MSVSEGASRQASDVRIRLATPDDAPALLAIYAPYVAQTAITFEYDVPTEAEFCGRIESTLAAGRPYLVIEVPTGEGGGSGCDMRGLGVPYLVGYAYTSPFVGRAAYQWAEETSIYLRQDVRGRGLGRRIYQALEDVCRARGVLNLEACIGYAKQEDEHLTNASPRFHERMGYRLVGRFDKCGYKFGTWYDMVWMEKILGEHRTPSEMPRSYRELSRDALEASGIILNG